MSWAHNAVLQERMRVAVRRARIPLFFIQAENDYDTEPTTALAGEAERGRRPFRAKIYPPNGSTHQDGHLLWREAAPTSGAPTCSPSSRPWCADGAARYFGASWILRSMTSKRPSKASRMAHACAAGSFWFAAFLRPSASARRGPMQPGWSLRSASIEAPS